MKTACTPLFTLVGHWNPLKPRRWMSCRILKYALVMYRSTSADQGPLHTTRTTHLAGPPSKAAFMWAARYRTEHHLVKYHHPHHHHHHFE